jgi:2-polyprenyl-3-methyl-5-hydroxy-6-metoxy-1,4-benzoquinol methylase
MNAEVHARGGMTRYALDDDPKRLAFTFSRYKFVARMLEGKKRVLEVGFGDGIASRIVRQHVGELDAIDADPLSVDEANFSRSSHWPIQFSQADILARPLPGYDAAFCLDVFEHIVDEDRLLENLRACAPLVLVGSPSKESQKYASKLSIEGHVNCKSGYELKASMQRYWKHVFLFSMNDEVVHTGFYPMAHYLIAMGVE